MNDVATNVKSRVNRMRKSNTMKKAQVQHQIKLKKKSTNKVNFLTIFLAVIIVLMTVLTAGVLIRKTGVFNTSAIRVENLPVATEKVIVERETIVENPQYLTKADAEIRFGKLEGQFENLEDKFKTWSYRSWITAVVVNENAHLAHEVDRRYHPQYNPEYLMMDENWKSNNLPKHQKLTEKQMEDIRRGGFK